MDINTPFLGVLCWEEGGSPRGLEQLESLVGNSTNPATYSFPVIFRKVKGANYQSVVQSPEAGLIDTMVSEGEKMVALGVRAIITSCGFNALFQKELAQALPVPVFTSALMQIPFILASLGEKKLAVITASKSTLRAEHFRAVGVHDMHGIEIYGMEVMPEWSKISRFPNQPLAMEKVESEVVSLAVRAQQEHPDLGAILLECTDLPPFANAVRKAVNLQVYDLLSMVTLIHGTFST
jgi:hypothetical protein